jgi:hypothetical protein
MGSLFIVPEVAEPEVNCANLNAEEVLALLGIEGDFHDICVGSLPAEDFKGRVLLALALAPEDLGRPAEPIGHAVFGIGIRAPRPAGYIQDNLAGLLEVADLALSKGVEVCWG